MEVQAREEVEKQGRMSALTLQLANLTASTLASSWRGPDSIEPTSPLEEPDDDSGDEPLLSGSGGVSKECSETELLGWGEVLQNWIPGNPKPKQLPTLLEGVEIYMVLVRRWPAGSL